jgi:hypothetical protein
VSNQIDLVSPLVESAQQRADESETTSNEIVAMK